MTSYLLSFRNSLNFQTLSLIGSLLFGVLLWNLPAPADVSIEGWHLFAIFVATIVGIISKPLPMGAVALIGLAALVITGTLTFEEAFSGFSEDLIWLVVMAFFIAKGFIVTGLGNRIAYLFVRLCGKSSLGLSYGLLTADLILAPMIPSMSARSAGLLFPILLGLTDSYDSKPHHPSAARIGTFLTLVCFHGTVITGGMFLTAMAGNPLAAKISAASGIEISWGMWALAAAVPGVLSLILMPLLVYVMVPPEVKKTPHAVDRAKEKLKEMGAFSCREWLMLGTLLLLLVLWIFGKQIGISAAEAALLGLAILLVTKVLDWNDIISDKTAWDTFLWFASLVTIAGFLTKLGFIQWASGQIVTMFGGMDWKFAFPLLCLIYFYSHYLFASITAHISSMFASFLVVAIGMGTPPLLAALTLIYLSNLFGGLTHYGCSPAPVLFGAGFVSIRDWWRVGFAVSTFNLLLWMTVGTLWWKFLGYW